jgi:hypothetical protein
LDELKMHANRFNSDEKLKLILNSNIRYVSFKQTDLNDIESIEIV